MSAAPAISVVMPTHDKAAYLERTLASWQHQTHSDYELLVIADGCTDHTARVLADHATRLPLRALPIGKTGRAGARNHGLAAARGALLVFSDDDRLVHPDFLAAHARAHARPAEAVVIGWQCGLRVANESSPLSAARIAQEWSSIEPAVVGDPWFDNYVQPAMRRYGDDLTDCRLAWCYGTTGNLSVPRAAIQRVGNFDEAFSGWGLEDTELHYRLAGAGLRTRIAVKARNYHQDHPRDDTALKWNWLRNARHFLGKHEAMDVALFIQAEVTSLSLADACRILEDAAAQGDSMLVRAYRRLLINHAYQITTYGRMS